MKICITFLAFAKDVFGGIENSLFNLAKGLRFHGSEVVIFTSYLAANDTSIDRIPIFRSAALPNERLTDDEKIRDYLTERSGAIQEEFCALLRDQHIDLVISADPVWGITQVSRCWECASCPIVLSLHVPNSVDLLEEAEQIPYLFRRTVSEFLKSHIESTRPLSRLVVIPNSVDTSYFKPLNNRGKASNIIFCNSRLESKKGIVYLIRAFASFHYQFPEYELWLCSGEYYFGGRWSIALEEIQHQISKLNIEKAVNLLPSLSWKQIPEIIRESFVIVLPTLYESFGRAALET